jgi:hypothetical protein
MDEMICGICRFWKAVDHRGDDGECRKLPPRIVDQALAHDLADEPGLDHGSISIATRFPITDVGDWCGAFEARPAR